ncbi:helix-turn-helix domain-containing protein [Streptomyces albireticuli]|uniref:helix-turn-helix domain-containing protein n=1 Tax=Streptomyces albireticuli TaxID=1940 RepID=UPI0036B2687D
MPPTLRQRRLGVELRKLRERAGLTSTAAAARLGFQQARMSMIEAGRYAVSADRVRAMASSYSCADHKLVNALTEMTGGRTRGWWDAYAEFLPPALLDLAELEHHATRLRVALAIHIPGLLQTVDHARVLFQGVVPPPMAYQVEHRLSYRMKRQVVIQGERPIPYTAIIHEAALRMQVGGAATARGQLEHLLKMGELDNVTLRVLPFGSGAFPSTGQPIDYASGPLPQLDTVQLDAHHGCEFLDAEAELAKYRTVLDRLEANSLDPAASKEFIYHLVRNA